MCSHVIENKPHSCKSDHDGMKYIYNSKSAEDFWNLFMLWFPDFISLSLCIFRHSLHSSKMIILTALLGNRQICIWGGGVHAWNFISFLWWCHFGTVLCGSWDLLPVSVHSQEQNPYPVFTGWFHQVKTSPCLLPELMGLPPESSAAGPQSLQGSFWVCLLGPWEDVGPVRLLSRQDCLTSSLVP